MQQLGWTTLNLLAVMGGSMQMITSPFYFMPNKDVTVYNKKNHPITQQANIINHCMQYSSSNVAVLPIYQIHTKMSKCFKHIP